MEYIERIKKLEESLASSTDPDEISVYEEEIALLRYKLFKEALRKERDSKIEEDDDGCIGCSA